MFTGSVMKGATVMLAPLSVDLGSAIRENSSTLVTNRMDAPTGRTGSGGIDDSGDLRRAQLLYTTLLVFTQGEV